jgi:hypothetical protein
MTDRTNQPERADETRAGEPDEHGRVQFGGGMQPGGGMVEPDEFDDPIEEPELPNDALADGRDIRARASATGEPGASDEGPAGTNADRDGDVTGYLGSDRVVGNDGTAEPESSEPGPITER